MPVLLQDNFVALAPQWLKIGMFWLLYDICVRIVYLIYCLNKYARHKNTACSVSLLYLLLFGLQLSINQEFSHCVADFPLNKIWQFSYSINTFLRISIRKLQWNDWQWVMNNAMSPAVLRVGKYIRVCGLRSLFSPSKSILLLYFELWRPRTSEQYLQRYAYHSLRNHVLDDWFHFQSTPVWFSSNMVLGPAFFPTQQTGAPVQLAAERRHRVGWLPWHSVASVCKLYSCVQQQAICWGFGSWFGSVAVQIKTRSWATSEVWSGYVIPWSVVNCCRPKGLFLSLLTFHLFPNNAS